MTLPRILKLKHLKCLLALVLVSSLAACSDGGAGGPGNGGGGLSDAGNSTGPKGKVMSVTWSAPSARANGDPLSLSEIAGYQVYYGTKAGNYPNQIDVNNPTAESIEIAGLTSGTYYLVLTTIDSDGRESSYSPEIVVTM